MNDSKIKKRTKYLKLKNDVIKSLAYGAQVIGKLFVNTRNFIDGSVNEMHDLELLETACIF